MSKKRPQPRRDFRDSAYAALHRKGVVTAVYLVLRVLVRGCGQKAGPKQIIEEKIKQPGPGSV